MPAPSAKVVRLLAEGRTVPAGAAAAFKVQGDHGVYDVVIGDGFEFCSCPAFGACSHIRAASLLQDAMVDGIRATVARHTGAVAA